MAFVHPMLLKQPDAVHGPYRLALADLGAARADVVVLGADLGNSTEVDLFRERFPERFFNVGAAEQNEVAIAAGLAFEGEVPFVHSFGVFLTRRAYEQVCVQVAMHAANVKLIGMIPGLTSRLGPTHQAIEDLSLMRALPGMTVLDLADATEVAQAVRAIADWRGPVYARMMRREVRRLFDPVRYRFEIARAVVLREGDDVAIVSCGLMLEPAIEAVSELLARGLEPALVHCPTLKPLDEASLLAVARRAGAVVTVENHLVTGGLGSAVAEVLAEHQPCPLERVGIRDTFAVPGTPEYLFERYGLTSRAIVEAALRAIGRKRGGPR